MVIEIICGKLNLKVSLLSLIMQQISHDKLDTRRLYVVSSTVDLTTGITDKVI